MVNRHPVAVQPRPAFDYRVLAAVVLALAVLAILALLAFQVTPHIVSALMSLAHAATSASQFAACGMLPGSCYTPQA